MKKRGREVIEWEALEHHHTPKKGDWFWVVGIIGTASAVVALMLGNILFGMIIVLVTFLFVVGASRQPQRVHYVISGRGVRIGDEQIPFTELESFCIDDEDPRGPQLLLQSERLLMPLIVIMIPEDSIDTIEDALERHLPRELLEESLTHRALEFLGF